MVFQSADIALQVKSAFYKGQFRRDLKDSDVLHWGDGVVYVGAQSVTLEGQLAPGPDHKLYLSPEFVETEDEFVRAHLTGRVAAALMAKAPSAWHSRPRSRRLTFLQPSPLIGEGDVRSGSTSVQVNR
jgi:hypothetical protein